MAMKRAVYILLTAAILLAGGIRLQAQQERHAIVIPVSFTDCSITASCILGSYNICCISNI